jgi:hypothetical protein
MKKIIDLKNKMELIVAFYLILFDCSVLGLGKLTITVMIINIG